MVWPRANLSIGECCPCSADTDHGGIDADGETDSQRHWGWVPEVWKRKHRQRETQLKTHARQCYFYSLKLNIGTKIQIMKCFDHNTTCPDTHSKIPPNSHIYPSKAIVWIRFQAPKNNLNKWIKCLDSQLMNFPLIYFQHRLFLVNLYIYIYSIYQMYKNNIHIYIYIFNIHYIYIYIYIWYHI